MFPWSPEFAWDAGHVVFFGALYSVLAAIATSLALAGWRAWRDARDGRSAAIAWHTDFGDLPASARACRHQLTGEAAGRQCERAFDCRGCAEHPALEALRAQRQGASPLPPAETSAAASSLGYELPLDRYYHRGHGWARLESDGTATVGLDELACRLVGETTAVDLPPVGARLAVNAEAARLKTRAGEVRVLAPIEGTVVGVEGSGARFVLRIAPPTPLDLRHLLRGEEAKVWALRELERLQRALGPAGSAPALADGGELVADLGGALPADRYDALLGQMLLEP